jgi:4-nitrophenyl phosphatase
MFENIKSLILDMDGVLWRDNAPIGDLPAIFARIRQRGLSVVLATNNATKTVDEYLEKLSGFSVKLEPMQIVTSAGATVHVLAKRFPHGGPVYIIGENGLRQDLQAGGFTPIDNPAEEPNQKPLAVVAGMDRSVTYTKLRWATLYIRSGVPFYGTNPDRTFPTPAGLVPGAGATLAAIQAATDMEPIVIGKPSPYMLELALERLGTKPEQTLVVGDRLETDIAGGQAAGCKTAVVLSGVSTREQAEAWKPPVGAIAENLNALLQT